MFKFLALACLILVPSLANAQRFGFGMGLNELYTIPVNPINATTFETIEANGAGGTQLWCAAGIYARRVLGMQKGRLYIKEARGASRTVQGRRGVVFTTQEVPNATQTYSEGVRTQGKTLSIGHAHGLCFGTTFRTVNIRLPDGRLVGR